MKKPYQTKEVTPPLAKEPAANYCALSQSLGKNRPTPEGCISLDQFAEMFHQKLDECYAKLSDSCQ